MPHKDCPPLARELSPKDCPTMLALEGCKVRYNSASRVWVLIVEQKDGVSSPTCEGRRGFGRAKGSEQEDCIPQAYDSRGVRCCISSTTVPAASSPSIGWEFHCRLSTWVQLGCVCLSECPRQPPTSNPQSTHVALLPAAYLTSVVPAIDGAQSLSTPSCSAPALFKAWSSTPSTDRV